VAYLKYIVFVVVFGTVGSFLMYFEFEMEIIGEYQKLVMQLQSFLLVERVLGIVE